MLTAFAAVMGMCVSLAQAESSGPSVRERLLQHVGNYYRLSDRNEPTGRKERAIFTLLATLEVPKKRLGERFPGSTPWLYSREISMNFDDAKEEHVWRFVVHGIGEEESRPDRWLFTATVRFKMDDLRTPFALTVTIR